MDKAKSPWLPDHHKCTHQGGQQHQLKKNRWHATGKFSTTNNNETFFKDIYFRLSKKCCWRPVFKAARSKTTTSKITTFLYLIFIIYIISRQIMEDAMKNIKRFPLNMAPIWLFSVFTKKIPPFDYHLKHISQCGCIVCSSCKSSNATTTKQDIRLHSVIHISVYTKFNEI